MQILRQGLEEDSSSSSSFSSSSSSDGIPNNLLRPLGSSTYEALQDPGTSTQTRYVVMEAVSSLDLFCLISRSLSYQKVYFLSAGLLIRRSPLSKRGLFLSNRCLLPSHYIFH